MGALKTMTYVALLRGIGPRNPNMHPKKLQGAFEKMGFKNVHTVIASGNVVFDFPSKDAAALEAKIEKALLKLLGFTSTTIIRSRDDLAKLIAKDPYKSADHSKKNYALVTFLKEHSGKLRTMQRTGPGFTVVAVYKKEFCTAIDLTNTRTPDMMVRFEKEFGKTITSRTWKTVGRILAKMDA